MDEGAKLIQLLGSRTMSPSMSTAALLFIGQDCLQHRRGLTMRVERRVGPMPALLTAGMRRDFLWPQVMRLPSFAISTLILSVQLWMAPAGKRLASF